MNNDEDDDVSAAIALDQAAGSGRPATENPSAWIVAIATDKDRQAFIRLFDHFAPRLKSFLVKRGVPRENAEDLVQEALLAVWRKAHMFDPAKAAASTWIFTIARNLSIDALRKEKVPAPDPNEPALMPEAEPDGYDTVEAGQRADTIRAAIAALPEERAELVRLSFFEDKSHSVIAEELGLPLGTVKSRLRLAFEQIRHEIGPRVE